MERNQNIKGIFVMIVMLLVVAAPHYAMGEDIVLNGTALTEPEMAEIRGGFQMSNGSFVYFSMDFMRARFIAHSEPNTQNPTGWMNVLSQKAVITKDGMAFDMQIMQAGGGDNNSPNSLLPNNPGGVSIANSFMNNSGFINANITTGNYNASSIANLINIHVGFFNIGNSSQVLPALQSWMLPY